MLDSIANWLAPGLILTAWAGFELAARRRRRAGRPPLRLPLWLLRPWAAWAGFSTVYQLNADRGMSAVDTAPQFYDWLFPFFQFPWVKHETLSEACARVFATPTVYGWGLAVALLAGLLLLWLRTALAPRPLRARTIIALLLGLHLLAGALTLSIASLPNGPRDTPDRKGSLLACWEAHATMLYAKPFVKSTDHFLRNWDAIHRRLRFTIHAYSHPPGGTLSMHYLATLIGAEKMNIRRSDTRLRYSIGMTLFAGLSLWIVFGLGRSLFGTSRHGLAAAFVWATSPSVLAYAPHAQDGLYAVFFLLALLLTWHVGMARRRPWLPMVLLGAVFFCNTFLNYSWGLATSIFALFIAYRTVTARWPLREAAWRFVPPLGIMTLLSGAVLLHYRLDYWESYCQSAAYVGEWYQYDTAWQHWVAWIGGQLEIGLMMGAVACSAFLAALARRLRVRDTRPEAVFLVMILFIYLIPVFYGPTCLRMETARCWLWVTGVPLCFAAHRLLDWPRPRLALGTAALSSIAIYSAFRLFLHVG